MKYPILKALVINLQALNIIYNLLVHNNYFHYNQYYYPYDFQIHFNFLYDISFSYFLKTTKYKFKVPFFS